MNGRQTGPMPYSTFLDQLEAGNVASVTFQGTEIDGRLKRPLDVRLQRHSTQMPSEAASRISAIPR